MFKQLKNDRGLILVVVLMIVIVMTTLTLSLISLNISQVGIAEQEVKRIQSELISSGWLQLMFARQQSGIAGNMTSSLSMGSTTFSSTVTMTPVATNPLVNGIMNATITF